MFTSEEWKLIEDALSREYSYCVMQTTRSRSFSRKTKNFRQHKAIEERIKGLQDEWSRRADLLKDLMIKVDETSKTKQHEQTS